MKQATIATDARSRASITLDLSHPRAILTTGKRGSGKTTTLHRLARVAAEQGTTVICIDPLGALAALASDITPLIPGDSLHLNPSDLTPDAWLALFGLSHSQPGGIALSRAIRHASQPTNLPVSQSTNPYTITDLIFLIEADERAKEGTKDAITNRLEAADEWNIFSDHYRDLAGVFPPGLHLVDLSSLEPGPASLRNLTVSLLVARLFAHAQSTPTSPHSHTQTWLVLDEAHNFTAPGALAAKPLTRWAREGRNLGLSIALATQRPATLPADIISQADVLIIHRLTLLDDVKAVSRLASTYARDLPVIMKAVRDPGQAIIVDDAAERAVVGHVIQR